jgi:DNA-binding beta-propeller fold protein YncE
MLRAISITVVLWWSCVAATAAECVTIAGSGSKVFSGDGGLAKEAGVVEPFGFASDRDGALYWAEFGSHVIRYMDLKTGKISTYAGTPGKPGYKNGPANEAQFNQPHEICFAAGDMYVADMLTHTIRRIDRKTREVTTVAGTGEPGFSGDGGPATAARFNLPISVAIDGTERLLVCDIKNHRVRALDLASGNVATMLGTGEAKTPADGAAASTAALNGPRTLAVAGSGDIVIVLREGNAVLRASDGKLKRIAGTGQSGYAGDGGPATEAKLNGPKGVALALNGDIYLADTENHCIRVIRAKTGTIETVVGDGAKGDGPDGDPQRCRLNRPHGVAVGADGTLYIGDSGNNKVRRLTK